MSREILVEFENIVHHDGAPYSARAAGEQRANGLWDGWVEFHPVGSEGWIATERETTQPSHETLLYWAKGLTHAYLEGALERALDGPAFQRGWQGALYGGSSGGHASAVPQDHTRVAVPQPHPVLDPFQLHREGTDILRDRLGALHEEQLRAILLAHGMVRQPAELANMTDWEMRALILQTVIRRAGGG